MPEPPGQLRQPPGQLRQPLGQLRRSALSWRSDLLLAAIVAGWALIYLGLVARPGTVPGWCSS